MYFDTDSVIFYSTGLIGEYGPSIGPLLGDFENELAKFGPGCRMTHFVSGGPKFSAFRDEKTDCQEV